MEHLEEHYESIWAVSAAGNGQFKCSLMLFLFTYLDLRSIRNCHINEYESIVEKKT